MFVRKKKNPSGIISFQVIDKSRGQYTVMKTIGNPTEVEQFVRQGHQWIAQHSGQLPLDLDDEANLNKRGYNKFLSLEGDVRIEINEAKIAEDQRWDGLKGYQTNTHLSKQDVIDNYRQLWKIEKAFRITKHDLKIRPFYHRLPRRIHAHVSSRLPPIRYTRS